MKVAELLFKNGFKEAYAIKGGVRGQQGWMVWPFSSLLFSCACCLFSRKRWTSIYVLWFFIFSFTLEDYSSLMPYILEYIERSKYGIHKSKFGNSIPTLQLDANWVLCVFGCGKSSYTWSLWLQAIQDTLIPPSVHINRRKKGKASKKVSTNGNGAIQQNDSYYESGLSPDIPAVGNRKTDNGHVKRSEESVPEVKIRTVASSSPYPNVCSPHFSLSHTSFILSLHVVMKHV